MSPSPRSSRIDIVGRVLPALLACLFSAVHLLWGAEFYPQLYEVVSVVFVLSVLSYLAETGLSSYTRRHRKHGRAAGEHTWV